MSERVRRLLDQVKKRKVPIQRKNFEEKLTAEFAPYTNANEVPRLEKFLFDKNAQSNIFSIASLRDRYCLLMTTNGILRGESLFKSELSDLCDIVHTDKSTSVEILIHVMRIAIGKTNGLKVLYGRCIRHKEVSECAIGALGLYLLARFSNNDEGNKISFENNEDWFKIKLLVDSRGVDNTPSILPLNEGCM